MVPLSWYVILSAVVFSIGVIGFLIRRNIIIMLISIEIMLNAVNISLVAFSHYLQDIRGQIFVFFVIAVAAAATCASCFDVPIPTVTRSFPKYTPT